MTVALSSQQKDALLAIAGKFGCLWGDNPNISEMLRKIADGELEVISKSHTTIAPTPPPEVAHELSKAIASLHNTVNLLYPKQSPQSPQPEPEDLSHGSDAYLAFYQRENDLASADGDDHQPQDQDTWIAICPAPMAGEGSYEAKGATPNEALSRLNQLIESTALPENALDMVFASAKTFIDGDPALQNYRVMLTVMS